MIAIMANGARKRSGLHQVPGLQDFIAALAGPGEPGMAAGIYLDGELAASAAAGCAVPEHGVPVSGDTMFDIASVSKHTTSACMLLIARDGLTDLDADIRSVLPELVLSRPVTIRQCLTHTGGLRDYFALCDIAGIPYLGITEDRFADLTCGQRDLDFAPGSAFSYSNTGYTLASVIVRRLTGSSLASFARDRVFTPLGMTETHFRDDVSLLVPHLASGYLTEPDGSGFRRCDVTEEVVGDGAIVTSIADLAGWHAFMASGAGLGSDIRDGLLVRPALTDGSTLGYALGLASVSVRGTPAWWHSGSWAGYRAAVVYLPELRAGISVLANRDDRYASHVALAVATALIGGEDPQASYAELAGFPAPADQATAEAARIAGLWHEPDEDVFVEFEAADSQLRLVGPDARHPFVLGTDGRWHGRGAASSDSYRLAGQVLEPGWGLSELPGGSYHRVPPQAEQAIPLSAGTWHNEELRVSAEVSVDSSGEPTIVIGLAAPRRLQSAGPGAWHSPGSRLASPLTVRVPADGSGLLVSTPGARRLRFDAGPASARPGFPRGLARSS
jgi:CubicO group peptidase (beta-lactamase class C family)